MSDTVLIERDGGIARVTLNRPDVLNALNDELCDALVGTLAEVERDPEVRVMVLQGAGGYFMAGGDLCSFYELIERTPDERRRHFETMIDRVHAIIRIMRRMPQPVVAKIDGAAGGFGLSLVLACDLAVAAADAIFTMAYCRIGTSPDGSSTWFLPRTVGAKKAMELALLGERFGAREAERLGIVNRVVSPHRLEEETDALARRLAAGPALAYANTERRTYGANILIQSCFFPPDSAVRGEFDPRFRPGCNTGHRRNINGDASPQPTPRRRAQAPQGCL